MEVFMMSSCEYVEMSDAALIATATNAAKWDPNPTYKAEVEALIAANDVDSLRAMFEPRIAFGTAGLRATMKAGYHNINDLIVLQTTQGLLRYIQAEQPDWKERGFVVGYDGRHNSRRFAQLLVSIMVSQGMPVYFFKDVTCTPMVPFTVTQKKAAGGVVVTASHNPKEDNGYKVFWSNGAQIIPPHDFNIAAAIQENLEPWQEYKFEASSDLISDPTQEMEDAYFSESKARYCHTSETNANAALNVTYTAMHGVGKPFITRVMQEFGLPAFIPVKEQIEIDPEFSTVAFPNPEEGKGALALAIKTAREHKSPVILANDPDADRLAVAELDAATGEYVPLDGNKIAVLLADWLWRWHMKKNPDCDKSKQLMVVSTVSGKILQGMANKEGFTFVDCLTGFKWMGNTAYSMEQEGYNFLFAYEVEIGFLPGNTSYDKDGVRTAGVFYELANDLYKQGKTLFQRLDELYAMYGYYFMKASYFFYPDVSITDVVFAALRDGGYPTSCGEFKIASVRDVTVGYDSAKPENKSTLPISPQMNMITFSFENGSVATLRPSGTEPKLKYYVESRSESSMDDAQVIVDAVEEALIKNFIQPDKYNMKAKANQN